MTAPLLSVEDLFGNAERAGAQVSPDGRYLSFLAPVEGRMNIWVQEIEGGTAVPVSHERLRGIKSYWWFRDSRHLLYLQDEGGNENYHVFRVDITAPDAPAVDLTPHPGVTCQGLEMLVGLPGSVVVTMNLRDLTLLEPHAIDIATGERRLLAENPGHVMTWRCDSSGNLFAIAQPAPGTWQVLAHDRETGGLRVLTTYDGDDAPYLVDPFQPTPDGTGIWVGSLRGSDKLRLVRLDVASGEELVVDEHPNVDLSSFTVADMVAPGLLRSARTGELLAARYFRERLEIHVLDEDFRPVLDALTALYDGDLVALGSDAAERWWVATFVSDRDAPVTYLYDRQAGSGRLLFRSKPQLDAEQLAPMRPVTIRSRDGWDMQCYLTLPVGGGTGLPMVVDVHGGPWFRDCWGFDPRVQFLANRGYAVLQVNFRGSIGFGKAFNRAAIHEFAGRMHDDLIDAVEWAVKHDHADPSRVGIMGGSYGGYAALVGITFTPDVFAAAVDYVGICNLVTFMRSLPPYARNVLGGWYEFVGDPEDPEQVRDMLARSPITRVDDVRTPLLVVHGANDPRVSQYEADTIVAALRERDVPVEYLVKDDEGHGFANPENLYDMFRTVERFLATHLGGRATSGTSGGSTT